MVGKLAVVIAGLSIIFCSIGGSGIGEEAKDQTCYKLQSNHTIVSYKEETSIIFYIPEINKADEVILKENGSAKEYQLTEVDHIYQCKVPFKEAKQGKYEFYAEINNGKQVTSTDKVTIHVVSNECQAETMMPLLSEDVQCYYDHWCLSESKEEAGKKVYEYLKKWEEKGVLKDVEYEDDMISFEYANGFLGGFSLTEFNTNEKGIKD